MKAITANLLNRFWKKGVKPIKEEVAKKFNSSNVVNTLLTTEAGYALDARQGKVLKDQLDKLNTDKAASSHTHDDRYYTESEMNTKLAAKSDSGHTHSYLPLSGGKMTGDITFAGNGCLRYLNSTGDADGPIFAFQDYQDGTRSCFQLYPEGWNTYLTYGIKIGRSTYSNGGAAYAIWPLADNKYILGFSNLRWQQIYAVNSAISTSDENLKRDINPLDDELTMKFIMGLNPISFIRTNGESGRTHYGMGAQSVERLMEELGMDSKDFAGFIKSQKEEPIYVDVEYFEDEVVMDGYDETEGISESGEKVIYRTPRMVTKQVRKVRKDVEQRIVPGEYIYGLRYEEFISPTIKVVQIHQKKLDSHDEEIRKLQEKVDTQAAAIRDMHSAMMEMRQSMKRMEEMVAQYTHV